VLLNIEYANLFVLGMMLYYGSQRRTRRLTLPTFCAALLMTLFPPEFNAGHLSQPVYVTMIVVFCVLIWLVAQSKGKLLDLKPLVFLGEISYSLYLIHQMAGFAVIRMLLHLGIGTNLAILFTISLMIGIASCLRAFVEKPAERWIKSLAKRKPEELLTPRPVRHDWLLGARAE
jgi:peptidoglycan/LPS O-acetylase OafA/YrhL